jgi:rhodanese-related sulfurtransferase
MGIRIVLAAVVTTALLFAGYQVYLMKRPAEEVHATSPRRTDTTPPDAARPVPPRPVESESVEQHVPGADAPFDPAVARRITAEQVKDRMDRGQKVIFVDTRAEIPDAMIKGAVQVPENKLDEWAKGTLRSAFVVVYCTCANEATAAREVIALQAKGFKNAFALRDGLSGWQSFDLPTEQPPHGDRPS